MDTHTAEIGHLQKHATARSAELSQLLAKSSELISGLSRVNSQNADEATVLNDLESVAENCKRADIRATVTRQCNELSITPSTAAFSAQIAEWEDYKNRCEVFTLKNQCISSLAAEAKKLRTILPDHEKTEAALKTAPNGRGKKRATAADRRMATLETKLASTEASFARLVDFDTCYKCLASKAQASLQNSQARLVEVGQKAKLAREVLDKIWKQSAGSPKTAEKTLRQVTEMLN